MGFLLLQKSDLALPLCCIESDLALLQKSLLMNEIASCLIEGYIGALIISHSIWYKYN